MAAETGRAHGAFKTALQEGALLVPRCLDCNRAFFYPRLHCPRCFGRRVSLEKPEGLRVRSYAWVWRPQSRATVESLPALMLTVGSDDLALIAQGTGWSESDPPVIGEPVEFTVLGSGPDELVAALKRRA